MNSKRKPNPFEQILRHANRPKNNEDDLTKISIRFKGVKTQVVEKKRSIELHEDPNNPGTKIPYSAIETVYSLDCNGRPLDKMSDAGGCKFGCIVRRDALLTCAYCKSSICQVHAVFVGKHKYCRNGFCSVLGHTHKVLWLFYRFARFCLRSVTGITIDDEDSSSEEELFPSFDEYRKSLADEEGE